MRSTSVMKQIIDKALEQYDDVLEGRRRRVSAVTTVQLPARPTMDTRGFPSGSIAVFVAPKNSDVLRRVASLARAHDAQGLEGIIKGVAKSVLSALSYRRTAYETYDEVPVFGELRYSRQRLAHGFFVDKGRPLAVEVLAYNGGELRTNGFSFVEFLRNDSRERLGCVVVVKPPVLSTLEQEVGRKVPKKTERLEITQGPEGNTVVVVTIVLLMIVVTVLVLYWAYCEMVRVKAGPGIDAILAAADPGASARSLLEQRTKAIKSKRNK